MADFKKLSDVEVVAEPIETANVLIEENGVIKKAPKASVGGGSSGADTRLVVTLGDGDSLSHTFGEMLEAFNSGKEIVLYTDYTHFENVNLPFSDVYSTYFQLDYFMDVLYFQKYTTNGNEVCFYSIGIDPIGIHKSCFVLNGDA